MWHALEPVQMLLLVLCGVAAGFINVVAGGGSLLTMPLMIFLGIPEGASNGTARVAIAIQNVSAVARYHRAGRLPLGLLRRLALPSILGGLAGALLAVRLGDLGFRALLGWVMLACAVLVIKEPAPPADTDASEAPSPSLFQLWWVALAIGAYGGMVQAGVGYLILFLLTRVLRLPLVEANILKVAIVLCYTPFALLVFGAQGLLYWVPALCLAFGQAAGGWVGAAVALERGAGMIRALLAIIVVLSAAHLLGVF